METEKNKFSYDSESVSEEKKPQEQQESPVEALITPEIENNPDLEDPRLYSPLIDTETPDPRIGDEDSESVETEDNDVE